VQVETKDDLRKRLPGGRSPDALDAWLLSLFAKRAQPKSTAATVDVVPQNAF
jgi:hypothetical protein